MKKTVSAICLLFMITLPACSMTPQIKSGEVYEKEYDPAETESKKVPIKDTKGKVIGYKTKKKHESEEWEIMIRDCNQRNNNGECATAEVDVDQNTYNRLKIGDWYNGG